MTPTERSCPGYCCHIIRQPMDHANLQRFADILIDGHQIAAMLQPTGKQSGTIHHYTCKHWDPDTRLCRDYENRPAICRDYPHGEACEHCGLVDGISLHERLKIEQAKRLELS